MDLQLVSFDDNYVYDFSFNNEKKEMVFFYDSYYDVKKMEDIFHPCRFVISNWSCMQVATENNTYINVDSNMFLSRCEMILEMNEEDSIFLLYVMAENSNYYFFRFYDASIKFELEDMNSHINVFKEIGDVPVPSDGEVYIARIDKINNKSQFVDKIKKSLKVPCNVRISWDNLADVLCDPYWLLDKWKHIVLIHEDLSCMSEKDMLEYKQIIEYCRLHSLRISFVL